jgi:hypothetical protein
LSGAALVVDEQRPVLLRPAGELVVDGSNAADPREGNSVESAYADTEQSKRASIKPPSADVEIAEIDGQVLPAPDAEQLPIAAGEAEQLSVAPGDEADGSLPAPPSHIARAEAVRGHLQRVKERYASGGTLERSSDNGERPGLRQLGDSNDGVLVSTDLSEAMTASPLIIHDDQLVAIRLGELVSLFENRFERPLYVWMRSSAAASKFVTSDTLAAAGIKAVYDPATKRLVLSVEE